MFNKLKMKLAAKRMQRKKDYAAADKRIRKNETRAGRIILWPFRMIGRGLRWIWDTMCAILSWAWDGIVWLLRSIWKWLCSINLIGLINLALLIAIIVLCSMLIINILNCNKKPIVITGPAKGVRIETKSVNNDRESELNTLPIRRDASTGNMRATINAVPTEPSNDPTLRPQGDGKIYGDVIIESRGDGVLLQNGTHIRGNLYLQNMHKYVLPCGIRIDGNLFLRDLNLLQFCGEFTVNGNIYVSPRSSFGPIPRNARIRGQIIL